MRVVLVVLIFLNFLFADDYDIKKLHIPLDLSYLNLTKKQKKEIKSILKFYRESLKKLHKNEEEFEKELQKSFIKDEFNKDIFLKKHLDYKLKAAKIEAEFFSKIHKVLNKKQRAKFIKYIEEWEIE